ncbi:MAG: Ornithine carbamoyltransferase [bacterium ADurb.Bin243]|nr:MAG: Ornithine carbamoyltransferase [bacterium ADurb.Bin243]
MAVNLKGRDLLSMLDLSTEEIYQILDTAANLKMKQYTGEQHHLLKGKTLGMIFEKSSTRTRVSFETGIYQLGGYGLFLSSNDLQIGRGEPVSDTASVLSRYLDGIMARVYKHQTVVDLAKYSRVPVINGLCDYEHPCQILADFQTIMEKKRKLEGLKLTYVGDGNNVCNSLLFGCALTGMHISVASPKGYEPAKEVVKKAQECAARFGSSVEVTNSVEKAAKGADVVYTDVWASMGQEKEQQLRLKAFEGFQVNAKNMKGAKDDYIFLHCLPAHRGEEVSAEVIDGVHSVIYDEAENRLHAQKAVMALVM